MSKIYSLKGTWQAKLADGSLYEVQLPGTLDTNGIGDRDKGANQWHPEINLGNAEDIINENVPIATRYTRKHTYEGAVAFTRVIHYQPSEGTRVFLEAERARCLKLLVNDKEIVPVIGSLSSPYLFEVTGLLSGTDTITLLSDNSYPGLPHDDIVYSSAATDETQTNWNGILGYFQLREEKEVYIRTVRVYPLGKTISVDVEVDAVQPFEGIIRIESNAIASGQNDHQVRQSVMLTKDNITQQKTSCKTIHALFHQIPCRDNVRIWDEYEGNLYQLTAVLEIKDAMADSREVTFGIRDFGDNGHGRLTLNNRVIFVRSETNCAVFPETGHDPMEVEDWLEILQKYKDYGINYMRFHSHCPPDAAFCAADRLGIMMQPELSCWNPKDALESQESYRYYCRELMQILTSYANHPSFVALTLGNELHNREMGKERMYELVQLAGSMDRTRLYAIGSNTYYGAEGCDKNSDFYTSQKYYQEELRGCFAAESNQPGEKGYLQGYINNRYPNTENNYDAAMEKLRENCQKPVFSFEVGQYEILPDFDELKSFQGVLEPENLRLIQKRVEQAGLSDVWKQYVEATGELSFIGYREEIEAVMRTRELSGISLLGLQDFPGQGTALVGMMNSHLEVKPYAFASPERFRYFFRESLPLVKLKKYTYETGEMLHAEIWVANYGKEDICGEFEVTLKSRECIIKDKISRKSYEQGNLTKAGDIDICLKGFHHAEELDLLVVLTDERKRIRLENSYRIWVYPKVTPLCPDSVYEARHFDKKARKVLQEGGIVYLSPDATKEALPDSIRTQFTTDFWSVKTFAAQEGGMGQLIDVTHPIFETFPTETHTDWQWWCMATQRAVILPKYYHAIVTEMDSYAYLRPMAQLIECRCGGGRLLFSAFGLHNLQKYPEARALQASIYQYLASDRLLPEEGLPELSVEEITALIN